MEVVTTLPAWRALRAGWATEAGVGFVPTMGFLHAGHRSLVHAARREQARVAVSIFVNPLQFGPAEDLASYPRDLPRDLALLEAAGVDAVFAPDAAAMYPAGFVTSVALSGPVVERLEGARRPGHFTGVATVVTKLFGIVQPTAAYFGQKDAQQCAVVRRVVADLNLPVTIRVLPIARAADGLALSSRNVYLAPPERTAALVLRRALEAAKDAVEAGERRAAALRERMAAVVAAEPLAALDYADVVDPATCAPLDDLAPPALFALVARVGRPRLLDNYLWRGPGDWETGVVTPDLTETGVVTPAY